MIHCKKSDLVQQLLCWNNEQYSLKDRQPMVSLYDMQDKTILLMMGRQYGKSTFIASDSLMDATSHPFFNTLYVSPRQDQTSEFSNSKLLPFIQFSPRFKKLMMCTKVIQNVGKKTFSNGSAITLKYAYHTADAIRGISADKVTIDEIQDIIMGNVPIIEECLSGSRYQWRVYAGTPKTLNNTLALKWYQSTQNEWVLKCPHCNTWNILDESNIGPKFMICKKCSGELPRNAQGQWVSKKKIDNESIFSVGFRVPQLISPTVQWTKIIEKYKTYPHAKFMNEVMALPCDNNANPLTEADLRKACEDRPLLLHRDSACMDSHIVLGVDWGHGDISLTAKTGGAPTGYTVVTAGYFDWSGRFKILGMHKFEGSESDPIYQVDYVVKLAQQLNVTAIGVDWGAGFLHNAQLKQRFRPDMVIEWQANDSLRVSAKWVAEAERMIFNRTDCMTDRFVEIKNGNISFFNWNEFRHFAPDFLTICVDFRTSNNNMFYNHVLPDDSFHSFMICKMTADHLFNSPNY